ncbi:MAG: lysophospholipase [Candidatus Obscuribacterales bacterium]|nr:lysophospholipase [Candidatus Obscuribacterales bacterium]
MRTIQLRERPKHLRSRAKRAGLGDLSQEIIGNIYQAITGNVHMPGHFVRRALANGLPAAEFKDAIRSARKARNLPDYLLAASEQKLERALYWDELGLKSRSRDLYLESSLWAIYAELLSDDEEKRFIVWQKFRESYRRAAPYFNHPAEEVSIHYLASSLSGYLRLPQANEAPAKRPVVVLLNSFFSTREELHYLENSLLGQGFATLSFDYPGAQGHSAQLPSSFDVKELGNSIYLFLSTRPEIDCSSITLYGLSLGGRIALLMALNYPERFHSVVSISTPLRILEDLDKRTPIYAREHLVSNGVARSALHELALHTNIEDDLCQLSAPLLVLGGGKDRIATESQTKQIFDSSQSLDKKLILCPGAGHNLYEMMPSLRYEIAQWIKQRRSSVSHEFS